MIRKTIQHAPAAGILGHGQIIIGLIQVKPRLLPGQQIDLEVQAADRDRHDDLIARWPVQHRHAKFHPFRLAHRRVIAQDNPLRLELLSKHFRDHVRTPVHGQRQGLHDQRRTIAVNHQSRQPVTLAPDQAERLSHDTSPPPVFRRLRDASLEKIGVEKLPLPGEAPGHNLRAGVVDRTAQQPVATVLQLHDFAVLGLAPALEDLGSINPVVTGENARARADNET